MKLSFAIILCILVVFWLGSQAEGLSSKKKCRKCKRDSVQQIRKLMWPDLRKVRKYRHHVRFAKKQVKLCYQARKQQKYSVESNEIKLIKHLLKKVAPRVQHREQYARVHQILVALLRKLQQELEMKKNAKRSVFKSCLTSARHALKISKKNFRRRARYALRRVRVYKKIISSIYFERRQCRRGKYVRPFRQRCFVADTLVKMADGSHKKIQDIKMGDELHLGGRVSGVMQFGGSQAQIFQYRGVFVTGEHTVFQKNKWVKVRDADQALELSNKKVPVVYDLATENHKIVAGSMDTLFSDFLEIDTNKQVEALELKLLNQQSP